LLEKEQSIPTDISLEIIGTRLRSLVGNDRIEVTFENKYWDIEESIRSHTRPGRPRPYVLKMPFPDEEGFIGEYSRNYIYVQKFTDWNSFKKLLSNPRVRYQPDLAKYQNLFERYIIGVYLVVGAREILDKYLIGVPRRHIVASSGIPSAHDLAVKRVGGLGFVENIRLIVDTRTRLSYGKQTISNPWLLSELNNFFTDAFRTTLINTAQCIVGRVPEEPFVPPLPSTSVVSRPELGLPISIKKEPVEEIELIALFYELIGKDGVCWSINEGLGAYYTPRFRGPWGERGPDGLPDLRSQLGGQRLQPGDAKADGREQEEAG